MKGAAGVEDQERPSWAGLVIGPGLIVSLCVTLWVVFFLLPVVRLVHARGWAPSSCEMLASRVARYWSSGKDGGTTYGIEVRYRWTSGGVAYTGDRYDSYGWSSTGAAEDWLEVVRGLPPGKIVTCYVNPRNPSEAVIDRDVHADQIFPWFMSWVMIGVAVFVVIITVRWYRKMTKARRQALAEALSAEG